MPQATQAPDWRDGLVDAPAPTQAAAAPATTPIPQAPAAASPAPDWRDGLVDSAPVAAPKEAASAVASAPSSTPKPSGPNPSIFSKLWEAANKPLGKDVNAKYEEMNQHWADWLALHGVTDPNTLRAARVPLDVMGAVAEAGRRTLSPLGVMTLGAGTEAQILKGLPGVSEGVKRVTSAIEWAAGAGFTGAAGKEALTPRQEGETWEQAFERRVGATGMALLGGPAAVHGLFETIHPTVLPKIAELSPDEQVYTAKIVQEAAKQPPIVQFRQDAEAINASLPKVEEGYTRLWRGGRPGETGVATRFTDDLPGLALPFSKFYGGPVSYIDVPTGSLESLRSSSPELAEFNLPANIAQLAQEVGGNNASTTQTQREGAAAGLPTREGLDAGGRRATTGPEAAGPAPAPLNGEEAIRAGGGVAGREGPLNAAVVNGPVAAGDGGQGTQVPASTIEAPARAALEELIDRPLTPDELAHVPFMAGVMADFPLMTSEQGERLLMKASKLPPDSLDPNNQVITTPDEEAAHITNKSNELAAVSAELHELTGGTEGAQGSVHASPDDGRTAGAYANTGATGSVADRPPVISDYVDRQLANGGITVVKPTGDLGLIRRYFGSLSQGARALGNGRFSHAANIIMDTAIAIARDTRDDLKGYRANVRSIVTEREWQDKVVPLLNNPAMEAGKLPPETPEHIAAAYKYTRELLDAHREAARDAKRQEMENGGMDPKTIKKMVPDDWGIKEGYYVHAFPGNWTITLHDGLGPKGDPIWTPIDTGWRQTTLNDAQAKAKEYLAAHPGAQLKVALDTVSLPGKGISDTTRLQELHKTIKDAHQLIYNDQEPEGIIKELLETSGRLTYGPRRVAPRGFGNVMEREANLPGWVRDMDNFERYIMGMQRYINLAPARASLFKLRNEIAQMTGMSDILKPGQLPKRYSGPYANMLGKLDSTIESLEGYPTGFDAAVRNHLQNAGRDPNMLSSAYSLVNSVEALLKLGFNPASAGLHLAQTIAATYPVLGEKWTLYGTAHAYSSKYDSLVHDLGIEATGNFFDTDTLNAYKGGYLGRIPDALRQLAQPSGAHGTDTIAQRTGAAVSAVGSAAYHALSTTGLYMFSKGVETARRIAAIGAYERALQGGADPIAARNEARDVMVRTQFLYNPVDSPEFMKSVPRPMGQFKNFSVKMFEFTLGLRGAEIPRWLAAMSAIGFAGFPMLNVISNSLAAVLPDHYNIKDEMLRHFPRASRGILGMLGVDYTKNIGFSDWLDTEHFDATHLLGPTASDLVRLAQGGIAHIQGPSRTGEQEKDAMWRNISPEARRIYDEAVRMGHAEGNKSLIDARNGSIIIRNLTPAERALLAAGLTPIRVAQERDVHEQIRKEIEQHTDQRGYFVDKLAGLNLELMRSDLNAQQRSQLTHELAATADMAAAYGQGKGLAQAVRERAKGMYSERLLHDVKKAPKALRGDAFERMQEFMTDNPAQAPVATPPPAAAIDWRDGLVDK